MIQHITIQNQSITITLAYLLQTVRKEEEQKLLQSVKNNISGKSVSMGDLNAGHQSWEKERNSCRKRIRKLVATEGWMTHALIEATCRSHRGQSSPNIFLYRKLAPEEASTLKRKWRSERYHHLNTMKMNNTVGRVKEKGNISTTQGTCPAIIQDAKSDGRNPCHNL